MSIQLKKSIIFIASTMIIAGVTTFANGQDTIPGIPIEPPPVIPDGGDQGGQGGQGGQISDTGDANLDLSESLAIEISPDTRNQGFVGATAPRIQEFGFVGAASDNSGPPLSEGATFGGGVNDSVGGGGGGGARGTAAGAGQGFGAAGAENGFTVIRSNLRTRLKPSYTYPTVSSAAISSRFNNRFYRLPEAENFAGQFSVSIQNRTATISGAVRTQQESDQIVRQLRLEPGVYSIDNQLKIMN